VGTYALVTPPHGEQIEFQAVIRGDGTLVLRPLIMVTFLRDNMEVDFPMLLDTGADEIVLPEYAALDFGLDLLDGASVQRGMLQGTAFGYTFDGFQIGFAAHLAAVSFPASVTFTPQLNSSGYGLLGREPLLDHIWLRFGNDQGHAFQFGPLT
jgi:hypothetical protein